MRLGWSIGLPGPFRVSGRVGLPRGSRSAAQRNRDARARALAVREEHERQEKNKRNRAQWSKALPYPQWIGWGWAAWVVVGLAGWVGMPWLWAVTTFWALWLIFADARWEKRAATAFEALPVTERVAVRREIREAQEAKARASQVRKESPYTVGQVVESINGKWRYLGDDASPEWEFVGW